MGSLCFSALLTAFRRIYSFVSACERESWFYWEKHDLPANKYRWQKTDPLLQRSFVLENADPWWISTVWTRTWKKMVISPSFDEPYCFFPGGTLGMVSFQPTDKNYGGDKIFNIFTHMRYSVGIVQACFWPVRRSVSNDPTSIVKHLRHFMRRNLQGHMRENLGFPAEMVLTHSTRTKAGSQPPVTFTVALPVQCRSC